MLARTLAALVPVALVAFATLDCGGKTDTTVSGGGGDCSSLKQGDYSCSSEGEKCESPMQAACVDAPILYCTCESGTFVCDVPPMKCGSPTPASCPPPDQVQPGAACSGYSICQTNQQVLDCQGNVVGVVECNCMGSSIGECTSLPVPVCAVDAGSADGL